MVTLLLSGCQDTYVDQDLFLVGTIPDFIGLPNLHTLSLPYIAVPD